MIVRRAQVPVVERTSPGWGTVLTQRCGDAGGITQFGAAVQTLLPGAKSSVRHWHENVDEFLFVLSGEVTVTEDDGRHRLLPGDSACWPAGVPNGHTVSNRSDQPCSYLIVGSRVADDQGHYVDDEDLPTG
ncbi:MAG: cupin domain-containing protein [Rubrivivax sp.]|nr:cupin domain-containing protein [Rubrivivax sp.]